MPFDVLLKGNIFNTKSTLIRQCYNVTKQLVTRLLKI